MKSLLSAFRPATLALPLMLCLPLAPLSAQEENYDSRPLLPTLTVDADELLEAPSLTVPSLEQTIQELRLVPGGASVTDAESYKTGRAVTLKDALDYTPGVFVQPRFGAEEARVSIRGSGIQRTFHGRGLKLMQDGVPLNLADGGFDMQAVDPLAFDYIEVFRGANALRYGATTLGGAINFVSPTGYTAPPLQARFEYGSFETYRAQLSVAGVEGPLDYFMTGTHFSTDGFREHSAQSNQRFFGNVGYKINDDVETRFFFSYVHTDSQLPGGISQAQLEADPSQSARNPFFRVVDYIDSNWKRDFDLYRVSNTTTFDLGNDARFNVSSFYAYKHLDHPILFVIDQVSHDFGLDFNYVNESEVFGRKNQFVAGFVPTFGFVDDNRYANVLGNRGAQISSDETTSANLDLYLENVHYLTDRFGLVGGGQVSYAIRNMEDKWAPSIATSPNTLDQSYWGFSPKAGAIYDLTPDAQLFFNASRSFEPPTFGELALGGLGGTNITTLDAQTATTVEAGSRGKMFGDRVRYDAAYYFAWVDDELMQYTILPGLTRTINAGRTHHQGVELAMDVTLLDGIFSAGSSPGSVIGKQVIEPVEGDRLVFRHNYLWNNFHFNNDGQFNDNQMPGIPEHYYRAELVYEHPCGFYFGPNMEWVFTDYPVDSANTFYSSAYALLGLKAGFRTDRGLSFYVEGRNLTDENYAATTDVMSVFNPASPNVFLPGDGRSVYFGLEYKF